MPRALGTAPLRRYLDSVRLKRVARAARSRPPGLGALRRRLHGGNAVDHPLRQRRIGFASGRYNFRRRRTAHRRRLRLGWHPRRYLAVGSDGTQRGIGGGSGTGRLRGTGGTRLGALAQRRIRLTGGTGGRRTQSRCRAIAAVRRDVGVCHRRLPSSVKCIDNADEPFPAPKWSHIPAPLPSETAKASWLVDRRPVRSKYGERVFCLSRRTG